MTRALQWLNLLGVLALAALCAAQWSTNRRLSLAGIAMEKHSAEQTATIEKRDASIRGYTADLDELRGRLTLAESQSKELDAKLASAVATSKASLAEREQLKASLDSYVVALAGRDSALKSASGQIEQLTLSRYEAIARFNDLAEKYNALATRDSPRTTTRSSR